MPEPRPAAGEEALIEGFLAPLAAGYPGAFGLTDDCATIAPPPGCDLVLTTDAIAAGVHFIGDETPADLAWKALAVNVSDIVAKGARPFAYLMALALPETPEPAWMRAFADGLAAAQGHFGVHLIGGDTDRRAGPLTISITAIGALPAGRLVRRSTARPGDRIYVSGPIGDAHLGLRLRQEPSLAPRCGLTEADAQALEARFLRPMPHVALADVVQTHASAAMDISDGLVKDLVRLARASVVGAVVALRDVPLSAAARKVLVAGGATLSDLVTGGEDYEVLACVPERRAADFEADAAAIGGHVTAIGTVLDATAGVAWVAADGGHKVFERSGWDHLG